MNTENTQLEIQDRPSNIPYLNTIYAELKKSESPIAEAFKEHIHWGYWENPKSASLEGPSYHHAAQRLTNLVLKVAEIKTGQHILDAGCGFGGTVRTINRLRSELRIIGLDNNPHQILRAQSVSPTQNNNWIEYVNGDACNMPFESKSFDHIIAIESIHYFDSQQKFIEESHRVLKPNGKITISAFFCSKWSRPLFSIVQLFLKSPLRSVWGEYKVSTIESFKDLAIHHNLKIDRTTNITHKVSPSPWFIRQHGKLENKKRNDHWLGALIYELLIRCKIIKCYIIKLSKT